MHIWTMNEKPVAISDFAILGELQWCCIEIFMLKIKVERMKF